MTNLTYIRLAYTIEHLPDIGPIFFGFVDTLLVVETGNRIPRRMFRDSTDSVRLDYDHIYVPDSKWLQRWEFAEQDIEDVGEL